MKFGMYCTCIMSPANKILLS